MEQYALITGGSKGIGRALAFQLARRGYHLLLISRSEDELMQVANSITVDHPVKVFYLSIDLTESGAAYHVAGWCQSLNVPLSILINNAGYGLWGNFEELDLNEQLNMLQLNITAMVDISHQLLPLLKKQKQAYILNVASTAAYQAIPTLAVYAATKAFIISFSRAIKHELQETSVSVSCLSPGPTDTGFAHRAGMDALAELAAKFNMSPNAVAAIGLRGMFAQKTEIVPGFLNKLSAYGAKHLKKSWIEKISVGLYRHKK